MIARMESGQKLCLPATLLFSGPSQIVHTFLIYSINGFRVAWNALEMRSGATCPGILLRQSKYGVQLMTKDGAAPFLEWKKSEN